MMKFIHLHRQRFILFNGLFIIAVSACQLIVTEQFWAFFGINAGNPHLLKVSAWYLFTFGLSALLILRAPEQYPVVIAMLGVEKAGAVLLLSPELFHNWNLPLLLLGTIDTVLSLLLLSYTRWLWRNAVTMKSTKGSTKT